VSAWLAESWPVLAEPTLSLRRRKSAINPMRLVILHSSASAGVNILPPRV
jgi:hypothetical protein